MGQIMVGGFKGCHFLLENWDLNLFRGGHIDWLVGFRSRFFGVGGGDWWGSGNTIGCRDNWG